MVKHLIKPFTKVPSGLLIILFFSLGAMAIVIYATRWGPWAFSDSAIYLHIASNITSGAGLGWFGPSGSFHPLVHYPPLYPTLLGMLGWIGIDPLNAARWLDIVLFGLVVFVMGYTMLHIFRSPWPATAICLLMITSPALITAYTGAMSESTSITFGLLGICLLLIFLDRGRWLILIAAAASVALSALARYLGIAYLLIGLFGLLLLNPRSFINRLGQAIVFTLLAGLPFALWLFWAYQKVQLVAARGINANPNFWSGLIPARLGMMELFWSWLPVQNLLPAYNYTLARNLLLLSMLILGCVMAGVLFSLYRRSQMIWPATQGIVTAIWWMTFALIYAAVFTVSYAFTSPTPELSNRTLVPVWIGLMSAGVALVMSISRVWSLPRWTSLLPITILILIVFTQLQSSLPIIQQYHAIGAGYTGLSWRNSETLEAVRKLPANLAIVSNETGAILLNTGKPAYEVFEIYLEKPLTVFTRFGDDPNDTSQVEFRQQHSALVLFDTVFYQLESLYSTKTTERLQALTEGLEIFADTADGAIYFYSPKEP